MRTFPVKLSFALLSLAAFCGSARTVSAAPPPGLRWGDTAFGRSYRAQPATPSFYTAPLPTLAATPAPSVAGSGVVTGQTIRIRGADGVVRVYPITGGVVQQLPSSSATGGQVNPNAGGTSNNPGVVIPRR